MATLWIEFTRSEAQQELPYAVICEARYGSRWDTMRRKRRWKAEFTEAERAAATNIFNLAHRWLLTSGVPERVKMATGTFNLWQKLGNFCASL